MFLYISNNITNTLPLLASGALLAQKSFPYLQKVFENWSSITQYKGTALSVLEYALKYKNDDKVNSKIFKYINFNEISFKI